MEGRGPEGSVYVKVMDPSYAWFRYKKINPVCVRGSVLVYP